MLKRSFTPEPIVYEYIYVHTGFEKEIYRDVELFKNLFLTWQKFEEDWPVNIVGICGSNGDTGEGEYFSLDKSPVESYNKFPLNLKGDYIVFFNTSNNPMNLDLITDFFLKNLHGYCICERIEKLSWEKEFGLLIVDIKSKDNPEWDYRSD